jgi:hypothetical protein
MVCARVHVVCKLNEREGGREGGRKGDVCVCVCV